MVTDYQIHTHTHLPITSILYVCRKSLREARPALLKTATIYLFDHTNPVTLIRRAVIDAEFFWNISHARIQAPIGGWNGVEFAIPAMMRLLDVAPNLNTMTLCLGRGGGTWPSASVHWDAMVLRGKIDAANYDEMTFRERLEFAAALLEDTAGGDLAH